MKAPEGVQFKKGYVLGIVHSLYKLGQSARDWNQQLKSMILRWESTRSLADPCLFVHKDHGLIALVYVNGIAIAGKDKANLEWFFTQLTGRFTAKDLGEIKLFLGMRIARDRESCTLYLDQEQYLKDPQEVWNGECEARTNLYSDRQLQRPTRSH